MENGQQRLSYHLNNSRTQNLRKIEHYISLVIANLLNKTHHH